jgi:hypothetical protein
VVHARLKHSPDAHALNYKLRALVAEVTVKIAFVNQPIDGCRSAGG